MWQKNSKWKDAGKGWYAALIVYNLPNGIGRVEQDVQHNSGAANWVEVGQLNALSQIRVLDQPENYRNPGGKREVAVRIADINGALYGTYIVDMSVCPGSSQCNDDTDTTAQRV